MYIHGETPMKDESTSENQKPMTPREQGLWDAIMERHDKRIEAHRSTQKPTDRKDTHGKLG